jgi:hypothetical protein
MNSSIEMVADSTIGLPAARAMQAWIAGSVQAQRGLGASSLEGNYKKR